VTQQLITRRLVLLRIKEGFDAARMMVQDYPSSATAKDCLARVVEMGVEVAVEAVNVT
jgi:hypothetical protein